MARTVKLENICGRCGRKEEISMDMQEALELEKVDEARDEADNNLQPLFNDNFDATYPDVVVAIRGTNGSYVVKGLRNLCDQPGAKRNKGCATRVTALLDDLFMVKKPDAGKKPKTPAKPKTEPKKDGK